MKNYLVSIAHPAIADVCVAANTKEEAIDKAKIMLAYGADIDFEVDIENANDVAFAASELNPEEPTVEAETCTPDLKQFVVSLDAVSHKEIPLHAISAEAALLLAREMYFRTDVLDFTDSDVERVSATVIENEHEKEETSDEFADIKLYYLTKLVQEIRRNPAPADLIARVLRDGLDKIYASTN